MRGGGTINADGFGVAWWGSAGLRRYRNAAPIWTDPAVDQVLSEISSGAVLAAVRSATVGMPVERSACAPFVADGFAFSHNGVVPDWRTVLPGGELDALTDSAALWAMLKSILLQAIPDDESAPDAAPETDRIVRPPLLDRERGGPAVRWGSVPPTIDRRAAHSTAGATAHPVAPPSGSTRAVRPSPSLDASPARTVSGDAAAGDPVALRSARARSALRTVVQHVLAAAPTARLNLLLGDGQTLWATTVYHSLYALVDDDVAILSSEPYDDDSRWQPIPDASVVTARPGYLTIEGVQ